MLVLNTFEEKLKSEPDLQTGKEILENVSPLIIDAGNSSTTESLCHGLTVKDLA